MTPYTQFQNTKRPHIAKYRRYPGASNAEGRYSDNNYATMRYAEVLLIAAEALAEVSGPNAETEGYVNEVRARARNWAGYRRRILSTSCLKKDGWSWHSNISVGTISNAEIWASRFLPVPTPWNRMRTLIHRAII
jgi:hypothetical protein